MVRGLLKKIASKPLSVAGKWQQHQLRRLNIHEYQVLLFPPLRKSESPYRMFSQRKMSWLLKAKSLLVEGAWELSKMVFKVEFTLLRLLRLKRQLVFCFLLLWSQKRRPSLKHYPRPWNCYRGILHRLVNTIMVAFLMSFWPFRSLIDIHL